MGGYIVWNSLNITICYMSMAFTVFCRQNTVRKYRIKTNRGRCRGDQGKFSHFAIKSTKKPIYQQILENEYCIWYKKYLHICVSNMNCTGLAIITWWAFKKSMECGSTYPSYGVSWSMPWGKLIQVVKRSVCTLKTIKFLIVYYTDIFSSYSLIFNYS